MERLGLLGRELVPLRDHGDQPFAQRSVPELQLLEITLHLRDPCAYRAALGAPLHERLVEAREDLGVATPGTGGSEAPGLVAPERD